MDPRFSECVVSGRFSRDKQKNCTPEDRLEGEIRSYIAIAILSVSVFVLVLIVVVNCCCQGSCRNCCKECLKCMFCNNNAADCCSYCEEVNIGMLSEEPSLTAQTLVILEEEDPLTDCLVRQLDDSDFKILESKLTRGQMMIIKKLAQKQPNEVSAPLPHQSATCSDIKDQAASQMSS